MKCGLGRRQDIVASEFGIGGCHFGIKVFGGDHDECSCPQILIPK